MLPVGLDSRAAEKLGAAGGEDFVRGCVIVVPAYVEPVARGPEAVDRAVVGPDRILFGSDSSFFPRGWVMDVYEQQSAALDEIHAGAEVREKIFGGNFERVFASLG